ncbi:MAG TPA: response regulator [Bacteroidota bacterium]|nr:response regulator [Bacteroidota bacterium]
MHEQILLVDDDPLYIDLVREILSTKNFSVIAASNGAAALTLLQKHRVTMIISDIDMPEMDGLAFHSQLLREGVLKSTPFVFLTGSTDPRVASYVRQKGIRLLSKSNLVADLLSLISSLLK